MAYGDGGGAEIGNGMPGFFWGNSPNVNQQLRQRLALQMMSAKKAYPKTFGEGLTAIGDAIGDIGMARRLEQGDLAQQQAAQGAFGGATGQASSSQPSNAPPDSAVAAPAALAQAVDRSIGGGGDASAGGSAPAAAPAEPGVSDGGYNLLDAQAGMKPGPGYLQNAIEKSAPGNPDMQAYLSQLSAKEAPRGPADVSSTGASGPFQFTRGTGAQYGLVGPNGDQRQDPDASTAAAVQLATDNAAQFQRINGRPPTMADLALMHQQGGVTGARMVAGTGNASPANLAVNNVSPAASPDMAASKIKAFYGMPERSVDPRANIAQAIVEGQSAGQTPPPVPDQRLAQAGPPSDGQSADIQAAPPVPSQLRAMPQQVAQAGQPDQPPPVPAGIMKEPVAPTPPPQVPMSPELMKAMQLKLQNPNNPYIGQRADAVIAIEEQKRAFAQKQLDEKYKADLTRHEADRGVYLKQTAPDYAANVAKTQSDLSKQKRAAEQDVRFGGLSPGFYETVLQKSHEAAAPLPAAAEGIRNALGAVKEGMFTGGAANVQVSMAKLLQAAGFPSDPRLSASQQFQAYVAPIWTAARAAQSGSSQISNADISNAKDAVAGNITLDPKTIKNVLSTLQRMQLEAAVAHQGKIAAVAGGDETHQKILQGTIGLDMARMVPPAAVEMLRKNPTPAEKADFDRTFKTPGLADQLLGGR